MWSAKALFESFYDRAEPADPAVWHRRSLFWPARTIEGRLAVDVWRRRTPDGWEYSDRKSFDEIQSDAW